MMFFEAIFRAVGYYVNILSSEGSASHPVGYKSPLLGALFLNLNFWLGCVSLLQTSVLL
jgi:hypothetical protein